MTDPLHSLTLGDLLREHRRNYPQQTALVCGGRRYRFPELDERVNRLANALRSRGVGAGDRILWLGQNCHRVFESLLAAAKLGAVLCPANWRQSPEELAFVIDDAGPKIVLWQEEEIGATVAAARARAAPPSIWLQHDAEGDQTYESIVAAAETADAELPVDPATPLLHMYTAAYSGRPNGALLSHTAVINQSLVLALVQQLTHEEIFLSSGPLFHMGTFMLALAAFQMGGTNVVVRRSDAEELCRIIAVERCTGAVILGPTIEQMLAVNRDGRYDLSSLRTYPGLPEWNAMTRVGTAPWFRYPNGYGQTEVMGMLTMNAIGPPSAGASGRPSPVVQVRIVDPGGRELPPGEVGEIVARGPTIMNGYHDRPQLNAERQRGGWYHTNDLGRREPDGSITFIGAKTRLIKSAAENIYPAEVEACIRRHPAVADCAVIGIPDPTWGQQVKAVVVLKDGQQATATDIIEHCRRHVASYKKPRSVAFVDSLPHRGPAVDYDALDRQFGGGGYPGKSRVTGK
jgi:acyl-CoA synthetase (AMP-forming)/AMP-acid ligase II